MPLGTQAKLLRVLENGELTRVGALKPRVVDVRFVASTNRSLPALVAVGAFRRDLYFRLNGITITVPPLRERPADIIPLSEHFLAHAAVKAGRRPALLASEVHPRLLGHPWPGNVRELRNVMERALALCHDNIVCIEDILLDPPLPASAARLRAAEPIPEPPLPPLPCRASPSDAFHGATATPSARSSSRLSSARGGNQAKAASILGVSRRTLINRLDEYKMARPRKQVSES
jgi:DNA-binding NtrC family response regulator